ncbi:MAG: hypothetical protein K0Q73_2484 [Paenibacillus sp.]|jgi:uncharacterized protein YndB with AHSA1/START domain|nr:hypothetical protein [Paenibacillus sp.]
MQLTFTQDIKAPIEKVFACADEEEKQKLWMEGLVGTEYIGKYDPNQPVGTKFKQKIKEGGRVQEYDGEVTAYEKPRLLGVKLFNKMFSVDVRYRFTEISGGTRMQYDCELTFHHWIARLMGSLFGWFTKRIFRKQMQAFKSLAESL